MSAVICNLKLSISSFKISLDVIERFFILTIDNKYTKNVPILQFILRASAGSIGFPSYFFRQKIENLDANNNRNENEAEIRIELEDEMN